MLIARNGESLEDIVNEGGEGGDGAMGFGGEGGGRVEGEESRGR